MIIGTNGDGSRRGGDGTLGTTSGNSITSLGRDDNRWMNCRMTGIGSTRGGNAVTGADDGGSGIMMADSPVPPEGPGPGINMGDSDLLLIVLLRLVRKV